MFLIIYGEWFLLTLKFQWRDNVGFSRRFFPRRLEYAFSATICHLLRHLQDMRKTCLQDVFKGSPKRLQDVFTRSLQEDVLQTRLEDVWQKMLNWRRLQDVISTSLPRWMLLGWNSFSSEVSESDFVLAYDP